MSASNSDDEVDSRRRKKEEKPAIVGEQLDTKDEPVEREEAAANGSGGQEDAVEAPDAPVDAPDAPVDAPDAPVEAPDAPVDAPDASVDAPVDGPNALEDAPSAAVDAQVNAPAGALNAPADAADAPPDVVVAPVIIPGAPQVPLEVPDVQVVPNANPGVHGPLPPESRWVGATAFPDVNENAICFFRFTDDYQNVLLDSKYQAVENEQDDFIEELPELPVKNIYGPPVEPVEPVEPAEPVEGEGDEDPLLVEDEQADAGDVGADDFVILGSREPDLEDHQLNVNFRSKGSRMSNTLKDEYEDKELIKDHLLRPRYGLPVGKLPFGTPNVVDMGSFNSLNYPTSSCEYKKKYDEDCLKQNKSIVPSFQAKFIVAVLIGVTVGALGCSLNILIELIAKPKYQLMATTIQSMGNGSTTTFVSGVAIICSINLLFCALSTFFGYWSPVSTGSGIPHIKTYLNGVKIEELMHFKTLLAKFLGVIFSVVGGMPVGKEGPMIHSGAVIGAGFSQGKSTSFTFGQINFNFLNFFDGFRTDVIKREFVAVGSAAGVAAAFGSPMGGVLFVIEEGSSFVDTPMIGLSLIGAGCAHLTLSVLSSIYLGTFPDISSKGLLSFGSFDDVKDYYTLRDLLAFALMGGVCGLLGALFNHLNMKWTQYRLRNFKSKWQKHYTVLFMSVVVTMVAMACMFCIDDCQPYKNDELQKFVQLNCNVGSYHSGAAIWFATPESVIKDLFHAPMEQYTFKTLIVFFLAYFVLALLTYGLPISSGLFIPCLLTGAAFGRVVGMCLHTFLGMRQWSSLGVYALVGSCGVLTGVARIMICICAILTEATGNHLLGFPILLTAIVAKLVADQFNEGIYEIHNDLSGVAYLHWTHARGAEVLKAKNIMSFPVHCFELKECTKNVIHMVINYPHQAIPIVEKRHDWTGPETTNDDGKVLGIVLKDDVITMLYRHMIQYYPGAKMPGDPNFPNLDNVRWEDFRAPYPHYHRAGDIFLSNAARERTFVDFSPILDPNPTIISLNASLSSVYHMFRATGCRHMLVLSKDEKRLKGMITRKDIYSHMVEHTVFLYGSREPKMGKKTQVIKSKNYWIVVRRY